MTDDRFRRAFRTGLRPFAENPPAGPSFEELTSAVLTHRRSEPTSGVRTLLAGILTVLLVGGATVGFLQSRDTASFEAGPAAGLGERFWAAVANGDAATIAEATHPDADLNIDGLADLAASRGEPLAISVDRDEFVNSDSPQLCYALVGPKGEARGSLLFRRDGSRWAIQEVRPGTEFCSLAAPSTTTTQPQIEFRMFGRNGFIQSRLVDAFEERSGEIAVVAMVPVGSIAEVTAVVDTLDEVEATVSIPAERIRGLAEAWVRGTRQAELGGDWTAIGLVPRYLDSPTEEWLRRLGEIPGTRAEHVFDHLGVGSTRIPPGWMEVADLPFQYGSVWRGGVVTDQGIVFITESNQSMLIGFDGSGRSGDPVPEARRRWMSEAYRAAVGDRVVYVTSVTLVLDVESMTWTEGPRPPVERVLGSAVIDGELYLVGRGQQPPLLVFDPEQMTWRSLEPVPAYLNVGDVTTDGAHLFVTGVRQGSRNEIIGGRTPMVFRYDPGTGWAQLPDIPIDGQAPGIGWADGAGLVGWNYDHEAALFTEGSWQSLPDHPSHCESYPRAETIPGGMYGTLCWGEPLILDSSTMEWTLIESPGGFLPSVGPDGTALYVLVPNRHTTLLLRHDLD